ncbi:Uncharacterized protein dnl_21920 [Desulfonema limicola]|uniref:Uncharacterized protein n=1 Tax=Desulfonema limicola TaxID=45656 RepID=A0A975B7C9_9BACT|nr:Uncharacterized protein dnl_21920 [Desulfonema limicola]
MPTVSILNFNITRLKKYRRHTCEMPVPPPVLIFICIYCSFHINLIYKKIVES